ncbi:hypothetical protein ABPG74_009378 [Tetrahymena malaccensis]
MNQQGNPFLLTNFLTPSQPNEDILNDSHQNNLTKPMLEMQQIYQAPSNEIKIFQYNLDKYQIEKRGNNQVGYELDEVQDTVKTEQNDTQQDMLNNYKSVRKNPVFLNQLIEKKAFQTNVNNNSEVNTYQQQYDQSSTQIQYNSNQTKSVNLNSVNSSSSNSNPKKNSISPSAQDFSISFPQLSATQSISQTSIQRLDIQSPTKFSNNLYSHTKNKKSSFSKRSSQIQQVDQNQSSSSSCKSSQSDDSKDSEKRDTLPSQLFTLGKEKEIKPKNEKSSDDNDINYDSFTIKMNSLSKFKKNTSGAFGSLLSSGEITQIKICKDAFSSTSSISNQGGQDKSSINQDGNDFNMRSSSQSIKQSGLLGNSFMQGSQGFVDLIKRIKIKNAIQRMANKTSCRRLKQLSEIHLSFIGDLSIQKKSDEKEHKEQQRWYLKFIRDYMKFPTFNPYSIYKMMWDLFMLFVVLFFFVSIPLILSTGEEFEDLFGEFPYYILSIILVFDAFINMNTGYYRNGALVQTKYFVLRNYAKKLLVIDVVGIIPIFIYTIAPSQTLKGFLFLYLIKYKSITKIFKRLELRLDLKSSLLNLIALLKLLLTVLFIAHIFANFWLFLARINPNQNWLTQAKLKTESWSEQYIVAYYYITVTMVTVGYGDITPANLTEVFFAVVTILLACGVFAYSVNAIGFILDEINREQKQLNKNMQIINQYMNKKNISRELRFQIREYLEFFWRQQNISNVEQEQKIIQQLAHNLKEKLNLEANKLILKDNKVFSNMFSERLLKKTLNIVKEYRFTPQQLIIQRNYHDDSAIYFIESGSVEVFIDNDKNHQIIQIQKLSKGQYFGEISFYTGLERSLSVRSIDFATLLKIEREDFLNLLKMFPRDQEMFHLIKDKVQYSRDFGLIGVNCYSCNSPEHLVASCPMVQFIPNKLQCFKKYNFNPGQQRTHYKRIMKEKYSTLRDIELLKDAAEEIQEEYEELMPETNTSVSELSCIEDVEEEDDDDEEEFYKQTPRHKLFQNDDKLTFQNQIAQIQQEIDKESEKKEEFTLKGSLKDLSPKTPQTRGQQNSQSSLKSPQNNVIHEDSGESDSQQSNQRISLDSKKEERLNTPPCLIVDKKIKFSEKDFILDTSNSSASNGDRRLSTINSNAESQTEPSNFKQMLTNQTIKQSKFSQKPNIKQRKSAIDFRNYDNNTNKNQNDEKYSNHQKLNYEILHTDLDQNYRKESMQSAKSLKSPSEIKTLLSNVQSSSLYQRRSQSQESKLPQLTFSTQIAQASMLKKEFPRIAQLRQRQSFSSPKNSFSSNSSYYMNPGGGNSSHICCQCQCQLDHSQTPKASASKSSYENNNSSNKNDNSHLQYGSLLVSRSRASSQNNVNNLPHSQNLYNKSAIQNVSLSQQNQQTNSNNITFQQQSYISSHRSSISKGINGIQIPQNQLSIYQQAMHLIRHQDSFSSSNSPRSRRHQSTSSSKFNRVEMNYNLDQITKKVNAIYDKLYVQVSQDNELSILEFDKSKDYEIYFPKYNLTNVLRKMKDKKKNTQINKFIQAFNFSRGQFALENMDRSKSNTFNVPFLGRSVSENFSDNQVNGFLAASPLKNRSARSSIFIPQNGQIGNQIRGLKLRHSINSEGQWEIKSATFPRKSYF